MYGYVDLTKMNISELKAFYYDQLVAIQDHERILAELKKSLDQVNAELKIKVEAESAKKAEDAAKDDEAKSQKKVKK
jgi:hypothetical protein